MTFGMREPFASGQVVHAGTYIDEHGYFFFIGETTRLRPGECVNDVFSPAGKSGPCWLVEDGEECPRGCGF